MDIRFLFSLPWPFTQFYYTLDMVRAHTAGTFASFRKPNYDQRLEGNMEVSDFASGIANQTFTGSLGTIVRDPRQDGDI